MQIDIDNEGIKRFGNEVLLFVKAVIDCLETLYGLKFRITPKGSFPLGLKIEEMDKFDFTLEWINMPEQVSELSKEELDFIFKENTKNTIGIAIQSILLECKSTGKVSVEGLTCKESAINIMLSWFLLTRLQAPYQSGYRSFT